MRGCERLTPNLQFQPFGFPFDLSMNWTVWGTTPFHGIPRKPYRAFYEVLRRTRQGAI